MIISDVYLISCAVSALVTSLRWFRVAQREHYLPLSATRFAARWWKTGKANPFLLLLAVSAAISAAWFPATSVITAVVAAVGPIGLGVKGRTSTLAWTRRLRTLAGATLFVVVVSLLVVRQLGLGSVGSAVIALIVPGFVDVALTALKPIERKVARRYVADASDTLERINPVRVAITGSYGKTTIKGYVRHLLSDTFSVIASPASFNNSAGLSRSVNEHLTDGTEVFVAEMGTYGRGEIAELVNWVRPSISVLAAIGPVHLERFGDLETIVAAKSEIFSTSRTAIINIDAHGLTSEADRLQASGINVLRCSSTDPTADVVATFDHGLTVTVANRTIVTDLLCDAAPINVACAVAVATTLDVPDATIAKQLAGLPVPEHRRQVLHSQSGVTIIDDTYNSNPAGAALALATLANTDAQRKVVVTPGMVELGSRQASENRRFGVDASLVADDLLIVGHTNRTALNNGARDGTARIQLVATRDDAIEWVRENLNSGDAVLYENDLPDHYA
ncbi:MAG: UDP-N-acetylmuramoyl-tripeptide--D-alanyl-D-alanine ligase [Acidimicrobiales bacterium]|jgi:UDP-N-acetylmuramoyl-tripeptide--D-alanyl-D-alanine ligase|nr:UDP-N-acetylmuramoyl-tripeptide--D-alanyl-D-alanine ligase [Acidimicrobiales bacterium]